MLPLSLKKITSIWILAILILFIVAIYFGITMRFNQGGDLNLEPDLFYSLMTVHGITMIGIWSVAGLVAVNYLLTRYIKVSVKLNIYAFVFTVIGLICIWLATLVARFHAGWTFLYPLPFKVAWQDWGTLVFLIGLSILAITWLVWSCGLIYQILKAYSLPQAFAWQHFKRNDPEVQTPPLILITTVSLIGIIVSLITAVILMALFYAEYFSNGAFTNDPLLMKNLTYFFGHTIANEALYLGLGTLYELMPEISGRKKLKTTWYVALGWNCSFVFILTAFFHHLYMDFVQPIGFQIIGQLASYFASLPAVAVTVFSVFLLIYRQSIKWTLANILFFLGVVGWVIGGVGALIDSTISNNVLLHNTLWVPAHFHTYNAMGNVLFSLAFFVWVSNEFYPTKNNYLLQKIIIALLLIGGFGFVIMFYIGGANSIPRRFNVYPDGFKSAQLLASSAAWFACIYLLGVFLLFFEIFKKCLSVFSFRG